MGTEASELYHQASKRIEGGSPPQDGKPVDWRTIRYKRYPRFPRIPLPRNDGGSPLFDAMEKRISQRDFHRTPLALEEIALLLRYSCGLTLRSPHRVQPSGGTRYPIEVYLLLPRSGEVRGGLYHYSVRSHELEVLWERDLPDEELDTLFSYPWVKDAGAVVLMTAVFERNQMKYGERGYRMILQESGHIGQNLYLAAGTLGIQCSALAGTRDRNLEDRIGIDGITESVVYALALGR